jgi:hypothetical protein
MDSRQIGERDLTVIITNYRQQDISLDPSTILDVMIHESLSDNTTHGEVTVLDIGGFEERIPIVGEEYINIKFGSKTNSKLANQNRDFVIYNMSPKLIDEGKKQAYVLYFVSEEYIANLKLKVSKSYKAEYGSNIVTDIYENFINNHVVQPKKLFADNPDSNLDSSVTLMHLVMAQFRPFECINLVAKRSVPGRGLGKFIFYENKYGFNFKSLESLMYPKSPIEDMDREDELIKQTQQIEFEENAVVSKFVLMPASALSEEDTFDLSGDSVIITSFKFESTFNVIANIVGGMYSSRLMTYDPVTHRIGALDNEGASASIPGSELSCRISNVKTNFYDFNYGQRFRQFTHIKGPANPLATKGHVGMGYPNSFYAYRTTNFEHNLRRQIKLLNNTMRNDPEIDNQVERWLLPNMSQNRQLKNIVLSIRVPGDHARTVGELVNIDLPSSYFPGEKHKYYSGNYLITELSHKIIGDSYYMDMKLAKESLSSSLFEEEFGATEQELLDSGADQSFIDALQEDTNTWEDEIGDEGPQ